MWLKWLGLLCRHIFVDHCAIDFILCILAISHDIGIGQLLRSVDVLPKPSLMPLLAYIVGGVIQALFDSGRRIVVLASLRNFA